MGLMAHHWNDVSRNPIIIDEIWLLCPVAGQDVSGRLCACFQNEYQYDLKLLLSLKWDLMIGQFSFMNNMQFLRYVLKQWKTNDFVRILPLIK